MSGRKRRQGEYVLKTNVPAGSVGATPEVSSPTITLQELIVQLEEQSGSSNTTTIEPELVLPGDRQSR